MEPAIEIDVLDLLVVLEEGGEKNGIGQGHVDSGSYEPKVRLPPRFGQVDLIEGTAQSQADIGLESIP